MKLHIVTVGQPKLEYAANGWQEYTKRLAHFHQLEITHIKDKDNKAESFLRAAGSAYKVAMVIDAKQFSSQELADFLEQKAQSTSEICFMIGGPEGLPQEVINQSDLQLSLSKLTFPHDLAMVILTETLYRASSINSNHPYHRA